MPVFREKKQAIAAQRSASLRSSEYAGVACWSPLPRVAGVTRRRCLLFGAKTPCKRVRLARGLGTSAAGRAMKSSGSTKSPGATLNNQTLARRAEGRMPGVT